MSKKRGGFFSNPFGGIFDFNHDGRESLGEQWIGFNIFEDCTREENDTSWRDYCEDGSDYDIDPEDYEDEYDYEDALEEAKNAWREDCEDGSEYDLDPDDFDSEDEYLDALEDARENEYLKNDSVGYPLQFSINCSSFDRLDAIKESDFPNQRRYNAAYNLAGGFIYGDPEFENKKKACCQFIIDNADKIVAANYLSCDSGFLYAQAIKDHFELPVSLPDEDEYREYEFSEALCKIAKRNIPLSFEVWEWSLETFFPYVQYDEDSIRNLTSSVIDNLYDFPNNYKIELVRYMKNHPEFMNTITDERSEVSYDLGEVIATAIRDNLRDVALTLFQRGLKQAGNDWKKINELTEGILYQCLNYEELESAEYFKQNIIPIVKELNIGMVRDEIFGWEKEIEEYINYIENSCEQYVYSRKNAWRKTVPDGSKYGLDPRYYDSESEYLEDLNDAKYGWREWYENEDTLGLDVSNFETQEEYHNAYTALLHEKYRKEQEQREQERKSLQEKRENERLLRQKIQEEQRAEIEKALADETIYTYCGVVFPHSLRQYHYRTDDMTINVGDTVIVPVGSRESTGVVVSVGQYMRIAVPYPMEKTKFIICKIGE